MSREIFIDEYDFESLTKCVASQIDLLRCVAERFEIEEPLDIPTIAYLIELSDKLSHLKSAEVGSGCGCWTYKIVAEYHSQLD